MKGNLLYGIDDRPPLFEAMALGFQHYLTMFGSTVAIPLLLAEHLGMSEDPTALGMLIGTMFFVSGITTLLQTTWGNRLPLIDLSGVSPQLVDAVTRDGGVDLVVLEGMGRAIESNLHALFTCDALKLAMIKDRDVAHAIGGELYDVMLKYEPVARAGIQ